jgi:hypothetical protein
MTTLKALAIAAGVLIIAMDLSDLVRSLIVPRPIRWRTVTALAVAVRRSLYTAAARLRTYESRDRFLAVSEPVVMLFRLIAWVGVGLAGFALVIWGVGTVAFGQAFIESGSGMFTLGFATETRAGPESVAFFAAAFGLLVIALQIAYLPVLYGAFNRRETLVTMLESRAGSPPWGPELLARHYLVGIEGNLPNLYREWETWCADVSESHTAYPSLLHFRSPHAANSWVVGLIAVLDSGALYLSVCPSIAPAEARLCVRMGFTCLRDIARVMRIEFDPDPLPDAPITLTFEEFVDAVRRLEGAGVPVERSAEDAWPHFRGWRTNYESVGYAVAYRLSAPPAPWTGPRRSDAAGTMAPVRPIDRRPGKPQGDVADRQLAPGDR